MANNPYTNKVVYAGQPLIDLTGDTATAADVAQGKVFHLANGAQAIGTAAFLYPTLEVTITNGTATSVTATLNSTVVNLTYDSAAGVWRGTLKAFGTWTVEATDGEKTVSDTVSIASVAVYTLTLGFATIYGVEWDGSSTTAWTRTDAAANFTDPVPYVSGASSYGSPFDDIAPWSEMTKEEDSQAGTLVKIPKFYYKLTQNGNAMSVQISATQADGFSVSPAHMDRGDGNGERDVVYIGRYHCGVTAYKSASGQNPKNSVTRAAFRSSIHNLGSTIWQADWAMRFTIWLLYLVEFADWNSQSKIGRGCGNNYGVQAMGYTDSMPYHTGTTQSSRDTYGLGTQYRNIEGLWDNVTDWVDGCYNDSSGLNLILNPSSFSDSSGGTSVGTPSDGYPSKFSIKNVSGMFPLFIPSEGSGSDSTYSCDYWYFSTSGPSVFAGGFYRHLLSSGLFLFSYVQASYADTASGSRLMKLP